jgi:membrane fusion protein (multidrug efflux system)
MSAREVARIVREDAEAPAAAPSANPAVHPGALSRQEQPAAEQHEAPQRPAANDSGRAEEANEAQGGGRRRKILIGALALAVLAGLGYGGYYTLIGRFRVSTDDAYVRANNSTLGARVSGHIASIPMADNAHVQVGDVIIKIDDGDYRLAVDAVRARIATQQATIERIGQQIAAQNSGADQAMAQLDSAKAGVARAQADYDRQQALNDRGFASKAVLESSLATRDQALAQVQNAQAAYSAAQTGVLVVKAQQLEAEQQLAELKTQLAKAQRDLDFTEIRAPVEGVFSNRMVNAGDYVQPGQRLGNIVPLQGIYIDANFKETQLERLKPGQPVKISIDAFSTRKIDGIVESISPASGAVFSLLPPDNATGNFTKIVQRVPVRIRVPTGVARARLLRPGMSVIVTVDTHSAPDDPSASLDQPADQAGN